MSPISTISPLKAAVVAVDEVVVVAVDEVVVAVDAEEAAVVVDEVVVAEEAAVAEEVDAEEVAAVAEEVAKNPPPKPINTQTQYVADAGPTLCRAGFLLPFHRCLD